MTFLAVFCFLGWANIIAAWRRFVANEMALSATMALHVLAGTCLSVGLATAVLSGAGPTSAGQPNWAVWGFFVGAVLSAVAFAPRLIRAARGRDTAYGVAFGMATWAVVASLYMAGTCLDHWYFWRGSHVGVGSAAALDVAGIHCARPLLFRLGKTAAEYRCPKLMVYGSPFVQPFVPWPDYSQGRSVALQQRIESLMAHAVRR